MWFNDSEYFRVSKRLLCSKVRMLFSGTLEGISSGSIVGSVITVSGVPLSTGSAFTWGSAQILYVYAAGNYALFGS